MQNSNEPDDNKVIELQIDSPLIDCIYSSETRCVVDCCGIAAFDNRPEQIQHWIKLATKQQVATAAAHVQALLQQISDENFDYSSEQLNHFTSNDQARQLLVDFLTPFKETLESAV